MKQVLLFASIFILYSFKSGAQQTCEVKLKDIQGVYTGDCKDDKANGKGKSVGTDEYEGEFKDGYPEGKGMYTWKDGHYFVGFFKKGNKDGKGDMYYESSKGDDSVVTGFWKKDKYVGVYEQKYIIQSTTSHISKVDCHYIDGKTRNITIEVHMVSNSNNINNIGSIAAISDIATITGTFYTRQTQIMANRSITYIKDVTYPFRALFTLNTGDIAEVIFNETGEYSVAINLL